MAEKMRARTGSGGDNYWKDREDRQRENDIKDDKAIGRELNRIFDRAADHAAKEIEAFYGRYAEKEGISYADAMRPVTRAEMEEYQRLAKIYVEAAAARRRGEQTAVDPFSDEANRAMRRYNMSMKVNRLEMLRARIGVANVDSYDRMKEIIGNGLSRAAQQRYEYYAGILGKTVQNPEQAAQTLVNASYHSATWSERIWKDQERLRDRLGDALRTGLLQGKGAVAMARDIRNAFNVSNYVAQRLMRTEMARVRIGAAEQSMQANGNTHYTYLAEPSACPDCAALADQVFPLPDMQPGSNAPPLHPFCRCAVAPYWDDARYQSWLDGPAQSGVPWAEFEEGSKISASIDARKYQYGRTPGVEYYGDKISRRQQEILNQIPNYGDVATVSKNKVSLNDLSALTAYTGHEFAMFTKGGKRCIMRGNETSIPFTEKDAADWKKQGFKWSAHTHPGRLELVCQASEGDLAVLRAFGQKRSVIINSSGHRLIFKDVVAW